MALSLHYVHFKHTVGAVRKEAADGGMASSYYHEMHENFKNNSKSREFPAHSAKVHSVAWSCDGRRLASGSFDKTASVFVLEKDRLVGTGVTRTSSHKQCVSMLHCYLVA